MNSEFYNEKAAARVLNIHFDTLRRWRKQGRIRYYRSQTGRISYRFADLMAFATAEPIEPTSGGTFAPAPGEPPAADVVYPFGRRAVRL